MNDWTTAVTISRPIVQHLTVALSARRVGQPADSFPVGVVPPYLFAPYSSGMRWSVSVVVGAAAAATAGSSASTQSQQEEERYVTRLRCLTAAYTGQSNSALALSAWDELNPCRGTPAPDDRTLCQRWINIMKCTAWCSLPTAGGGLAFHPLTSSCAGHDVFAAAISSQRGAHHTPYCHRCATQEPGCGGRSTSKAYK